MLDLNEIAIFVQVVEAGSFSAAARKLNLPRSTVSRKVAQLEKALDIRLLQRSTRKLNLTDSGREYYAQCSNALNEIEHANQKLTEAIQEPSGVLRISAPLAAQSTFMADWIIDFLSLHPKVSTEVLLSDDNVDLIEDRIDIAFRTGTLKDSTMVARKLGDSRLVLCASPAYLQQSQRLKTLKDLKYHQCIVSGTTNYTYHWHLKRFNKNESITVHGRVIVNSMEFGIKACLSGMGIALLPVSMVRSHIESNQLQHVLKDYSSGAVGLYIVYPSKKHLNITSRTFIDFISGKVNEGLPWDMTLI
jgi:DNA-binding transcriptional LysR family regulator